MNGLKSLRIFLAAAATAALMACAAQDVFRMQRDAESKYFEAERVAPQSPLTQEAATALEEGRTAARDSRFDIAAKKFREAEQKSRESISVALAPPPPPPPPPPAPVVVDEPAKPRRVLPRDVLAKYLAEKSRTKKDETKGRKESSASKPKTSKVIQSGARKVEKTQLPTLNEDSEVASASSEAGPPEPASPATSAAPVTAEAPTTSGDLTDAADLGIDAVAGSKVRTVEAKPRVTEKTVVAPADPLMKKPPAAETHPTAKQRNLRRVPGSLSFQTNDASLDGPGMANLDLMAKYLLENPSTTFVLSPITGPGESGTLPEARFETSRAYLLGKGVPEDQIQLDNVRRSGPRGEFEFFVIEH